MRRVKAFSVLLCDELAEKLDRLVSAGYFTSRSAAIRYAIKKLIKVTLEERNKATYENAYFCSHCGVWIPRKRALLLAFCPVCKKRLRTKPH